MRKSAAVVALVAFFALISAAHSDEGLRAVQPAIRSSQLPSIVQQQTTVSANAAINAGSVSLPAVSGAAPVFALAGSDVAGTKLYMYSWGGTPQLNFRRTDGTSASQTAIANGDQLASVNILGWSGAAEVGGAQLTCLATETWTSSVNGTKCLMYTTKTGTTGLVAASTWWGDGVTLGVPQRYGNATVSAAGTNLASATALTNDINVVSGGTGGVSLPAYNATEGGVQRVEIANVSGAAISVYPPSASVTLWNLNGSTSAGAAGAAVTLANGTHGTFECYSATQCVEAP